MFLVACTGRLYWPTVTGVFRSASKLQSCRRIQSFKSMATSSIGGALAVGLSNVYTDFIKTRHGRLDAIPYSPIPYVSSTIKVYPMVVILSQYASALVSGSTGGASGISLSNFSSNFSKTRCVRPETSYGLQRCWMGQKPIWVAGLMDLQRSINSLTVSCGPSSKSMKDSEECSEKKSISSTSHIIPNSLEVESLLTQICDTSIAEFELKLGGFLLYVMRDVRKKEPPLPPSPPTITTNGVAETHESNGSVTTSPLALSKSEPSVGRIQRMLETATDEGLVILQSPKVGYFRRSRTIKGKRAPPACKEKQTVKEGQVLCYIEQLGGEIPIESDVSGEVIKILREDGEPVGYGDALIAILPSFPGIKKLQ